MRLLFRAATLALALATWSCDTAPTGLDAAAGMSRVNVFLADGPGAVEAVWLQFDQIYLISIEGAEGGRLVELLDEPTGLIEVTSLVDSVEALALSVPVEPGAYNELRLILGSAVLETEEGKVFTFGGAEHPGGLEATGQLRCPSCSSSGLKVVFDVEMEEGTGDIIVDFDVGQSTFRCDLAVRKPGESRYSLGILIDGDDYFAEPDALERDMMKPRLLRNFGWRITHVLTKDWHADADAELARVLALL